MKKEEQKQSSSSQKSRPVNIIFAPQFLEVDIENKIKLQIAFYRHQKVCKTPPMKFIKKNQATSPNGFVIETPNLQFFTTLNESDNQRQYQNKVLNLQMACEIDGNKHTFEEKINLKDYLSPLKESNIVKFSLSTNPSIILKCGVHAKFLEQKRENKRKTKKVSIQEQFCDNQTNNENKSQDIQIMRTAAKSEGKTLKETSEKKNNNSILQQRIAKMKEEFDEKEEKQKKKYMKKIEELKQTIEEIDQKSNEDLRKIKQLQNSNKALEKKINDLEYANKDVSKSFKDLQKANQELKTNMQDISSNKTNINSQNEKYLNELKHKNTVIERLENEIESCQRENQKLQQKMRKIEREQQQMREKYKQSEKKNVMLTSQMMDGQYMKEKLKKQKQELQKKIRKQEEEYEHQIQCLKEQKKAVSMKKIGGDSIDMDKMKNKINSLEKDLQSKKELIKLLGQSKQSKQNELKEQYQNLRQQNVQLKEQIHKNKKGEDSNCALQFKIMNEKLRKQCDQAKKNEKNLLIEKSQVQKRFNSMQQDIIKSKEVIATVLNLIQQYGSEQLITMATDCIA